MNKMLKRLLAMAMVLSMVFSMVPATAFATVTDADLVISTADQLKAFADEVNGGNSYQGKTVVLANDIDLEYTAVVIGTIANPFKGTFDGQGYTVANLTVYECGADNDYFADTDDCVGLFGVINTPAVVKNVTVSDPYIVGSSYVGGIVGMAYTGTIENCHVVGEIDIEGVYMVGGITGHGYARIYDCSVIGAEGWDYSYIGASYQGNNLEGDNVGGIVGHNAENNVIDGCTVKNVTVSGTRKVGGIVGITAQSTTVTNCAVSNVIVETTATEEYANANTKTMSIGGIVGQYMANSNGVGGKLSNCQVEDLTFANENGVTVNAGALTGGVRASSGTTFAPDEESIETSGNAVSKVEGENVSYMEPVVVWDGININNLSDLKAFRDAVNAGDNFAGKTVVLNVDIDLEGEEWTPIGYMGKNFVGTFDGQNHTISNLVITKTTSNTAANNGIGLFGRVDSPAVIKNFTIENVDITGSLYVGAVVGYGYTGKSIENVTVKGDITIDAWWYAGVIGGNGYMNLVQNCHVVANDGSYIKGNNGSYIGGIWGFRGENANKIIECTVTNLDIIGVDRVGGICGIGHYGNIITDCEVKDSTITATDPEATTVGLIVGACQGTTSEPTVFNGNAASNTTAQKDNGDGTFTTVSNIYGTNIDGSKPITNIVVTLNGVPYNTLEEAIAAAKNGDVIDILADLELNKTITISKSVTINGNGHTIRQVAGVATNNHALFYIDGNSNVTVQDIVFDGINGSVIRTVGANVIIDGCTFKNGTHTGNQGIVRLNIGNAVVQNCKFLNNTCTMGVTFNFDAGNDTDTFVLDNCVFEGNTANDTALVYYVTGAGATITNNEFVGNTTHTTGNGATIYMGFTENNVIKSNLFENNEVISTGTGTRVGGALFFGYETELSGNAFVNNTAVNSIGSALGQICTSTYYNCDIDLSGNYWGGEAPVYGKDYTVQHQTGDAEFVVDDYYTEVSKDASGNVALSGQVTLTYVAQIGKFGYATLEEAVAAAANGDTITLLINLELTETLTIPAGKTIVLELNGKTISQTKAQTAAYQMILNDGNLTIQDSVGGGKISYTDSGNGGSYISNTITNRGTLTLLSGTVENLSSSTVAYNGFPYAIDNSIWGPASEVVLNIKGGTVTCASYSSLRIFAQSTTEAITINISGGTINGRIEVQNPSNKTTDEFVGVLNVTDGVINKNNSSAAVMIFGDGSSAKGLDVNISGGSFTGAIGYSSYYPVVDFDENVITGGTFDTDVSAFCADGFVCYAMSNGIYGVVSGSYVAEINGTKYQTLADAFAAAENGDVIVLLNDVVLDASINNTKNVTLDLNGKTITGTDTTEKNFGLINNTGVLTINDSVGGGAIFLTATVNSGWNRYSAVISNNPGGTLVVNGGIIEHLGGTDMAYAIDSLTNGNLGDVSVTINGGIIKSTYRAIRQFLNSNIMENELIINGGVVEGANKGVFFHDPSTKANNGTLVIGDNATVNSVYLYVTEGSTEWPVEVSISTKAVAAANVISKNVPEGLGLQNYNGNISIAEVPELPSATISEISKNDLTFAMNFKVNPVTQAQLAYYGNWYADFELVFNKTVVLNNDGTGDGWLAGQYDDYGSDWLTVPYGKYAPVTLNANEALKIMAFAAEITGEPGLKYTYAEIYEVVRDFDCGMYLDNEFLAANPDLEVTLRLKMYNPADESESYIIGETFTFTNPSVAQNTTTNKVYATLSQALMDCAAGQTVILLKDVNETIIPVLENTTLDLNGYTLTASYVSSFGDIVDNSADNSGLLKVAVNRIMLREENTQLPVRDGDGYRFVQVLDIATAYVAAQKMFAFQVYFEPEMLDLLLRGQESTGVTIQVKVSWKEPNGYRSQNFIYIDEFVQTYLNSYNSSIDWYGEMFTLVLDSTDEFQDLTFTAVAVSETGVSFASAPLGV